MLAGHATHLVCMPAGRRTCKGCSDASTHKDAACLAFSSNTVLLALGGSPSHCCSQVSVVCASQHRKHQHLPTKQRKQHISHPAVLYTPEGMLQMSHGRGPARSRRHESRWSTMAELPPAVSCPCLAACQVASAGRVPTAVAIHQPGPALPLSMHSTQHLLQTRLCSAQQPPSLSRQR